MPNPSPLVIDLFSLVDRFRQNETILKQLQDSECVVFVGYENGPNLLTDAQVDYVKTELVRVVTNEQKDTWSKVEGIINAGSPYQ